MNTCNIQCVSEAKCETCIMNNCTFTMISNKAENACLELSLKYGFEALWRICNADCLKMLLLLPLYSQGIRWEKPAFKSGDDDDNDFYPASVFTGDSIGKKTCIKVWGW